MHDGLFLGLLEEGGVRGGGGGGGGGGDSQMETTGLFFISLRV